MAEKMRGFIVTRESHSIFGSHGRIGIRSRERFQSGPEAGAAGRTSVGGRTGLDASLTSQKDCAPVENLGQTIREDASSRFRREQTVWQNTSPPSWARNIDSRSFARASPIRWTVKRTIGTGRDTQPSRYRPSLP